MALSVCIIGASTGSISAQDSAKLKSYVTEEVMNELKDLIQKPVVLLSVSKQNEKYSSLSQREINSLDSQWRNERGSNDQPLIAPTLNNPLSTYLTQIQAGSLGLYTEMFVVDSKGLNVGQSAITSDFWQGDEAKYQKTYPLGRGAVFLDEPEFHEDSKTWRVQFNMTVSDESGRAIGASTVEMNLTELERRSK
jgi:hypothetical protein